jgi:hypothetical protein
MATIEPHSDALQFGNCNAAKAGLHGLKTRCDVIEMHGHFLAHNIGE